MRSRETLYKCKALQRIKVPNVAVRLCGPTKGSLIEMHSFVWWSK